MRRDPGCPLVLDPSRDPLVRALAFRRGDRELGQHPRPPGRPGRSSRRGSLASVELPVNRINPAADVPSYLTAGSVGFDLSTAEQITIPAGEMRQVGTGLIFAVPAGWGLMVVLRSSAPERFGVLQPHGIGIIDRDYCGPDDEVMLQLLNFRSAEIMIPTGSRIAQGILVRAEQASFVAHRLGRRSRGGFGSTDQ
jgi:dUTP pyrophosphatase